MLRKIKDEYGNDFKKVGDDERKIIGVKVIMGAVHKVTTTHVVSAPLTSYILRNGSRFKFSHDFVHMPLIKLCNLDNNIEDYVLQTDENEEGETKKFFSSAISDYICRPQMQIQYE